MTGRRIMAAEDIRRAVIRISHEIVEKQAGTDGLALIGIQRRGVPLAHRIAEAIREHEGTVVPVGALDITFYRDDLSLVAPLRSNGIWVPLTIGCWATSDKSSR